MPSRPRDSRSRRRKTCCFRKTGSTTTACATSSRCAPTGPLPTAECRDACDRLLGEGKLPAEHRARVSRNRALAAAKLAESGADVVLNADPDITGAGKASSSDQRRTRVVADGVPRSVCGRAVPRGSGASRMIRLAKIAVACALLVAAIYVCISLIYRHIPCSLPSDFRGARRRLETRMGFERSRWSNHLLNPDSFRSLGRSDFFRRASSARP